MADEPETNARLAAHLRLVEESEAGHLDDLQCPKCGQMAVSVWFTNPAVDFYRTWFLCEACDFHSRAQNSQKPKFFSENRVSAELQERDLLILKQAKFKRPPKKVM